MLGRWIFFLVLFIVGIGLALHLNVEVPWVGQWFGKLPGDLIIRKGGMVLDVPLTTSALCSLVLSLVASLLFGPPK